MKYGIILLQVIVLLCFYYVDIRLRVRVEYSDYVIVLIGNVNLNKVILLERQFEKFMQVTNILKFRDLGFIVCDIKFIEFIYLDVFWRDYLNGFLLEVLKGVFIIGGCIIY